jgi:hypothetical protein
LLPTASASAFDRGLCSSFPAFHALKKLIFKASEMIKSKAKIIRLKTDLKLSTLQTLILQDAIGRTARKAAEWAKHYKTTSTATPSFFAMRKLSWPKLSNRAPVIWVRAASLSSKSKCTTCCFVMPECNTSYAFEARKNDGG